MDKDANRVKLTPAKVFFRSLKWILIAAVLAMMAWLTFCGIMQKGTKRMKGFLFTDGMAEQYNKNGGISVVSHGEYNVSSLDKVFYISKIYSAKQDNGLEQFQFMLRWNVNSSSLEDIGREPEDFVFLLIDDGGKVYSSYSCITDSKLMYRYIRLVFDDVDTTLPVELKVYVYRNTGVPTDRTDFFETCEVWYSDGYRDSYSLTSYDKKRIGKDNGIRTENVIIAGREN